MTRDERAFLDHLAKTHQDAMVWLTYRRTGDSQLARDLVQETFLLACCKIHILRRHKNPAGWLYNALKKLTMRELSRQRYSAEVPLEDGMALAEEVPDLPMEEYLPHSLSEKERELLLWRIRDGLSFQEISDRRGFTEAACRKQVSRLIQKCRQLLDEGVKNF